MPPEVKMEKKELKQSKTSKTMEDKETKKVVSKKPKALSAAKAEAAAAAKAAPKVKKLTGVRTNGKRAPLAVQTTFAKTGAVVAKWRLIDATNIPLGRLSSAIALILMGKDKPEYTPNHDTGDFVIVVNAEKVQLTGKKWEQKTYYHHTNYPGGIKSYTAKDVRDTNPERLVEWSVWGMLPKSKGPLVRTWYKKLKVYSGADHPHKAQKVETVKLTNIGQQGVEA